MNEDQLKQDYQSLADVLARAWEQAAVGKGAQRHGNSLPFDAQPMQQINGLLGSDHGFLYQAIKKLQESCRMDTDAAIRERLGAINYIAGSIIFLESTDETSCTSDSIGS